MDGTRDMTFTDVLYECIKHPDFVQQFNRLSGCELGDRRALIVKMIDEATGYQAEVDKQQAGYMRQFVEFVYDVIWLRLRS